MIRPLVALTLTVMALPASAETVRVMSYNVRVDVETDIPRWSDRREPMAKQIAFTDPDLLGVQEARAEAVADLAARLPGYTHYGIGRDDGKIGESTTLFWRSARFRVVQTTTQWCSRKPDTPGKDYDAAYPRTITRVILRDRTSGQLYDIRNTHFDHIGVVAREACARQIEATPAYKNAHVILMGDFNSGPDSAPYRVLTDTDGLNLKDARNGARVDFGPAGTFNGFDIARSGQAIDHIFVARDAQVNRYGVLTDTVDGKVISDHFPIVADIQISRR